MIQGLDTASVDGNASADWQEVRAAGYSFAFVRAFYGTRLDHSFKRDWAGLADAKMTRGAYLFWVPNQDDDDQVDAWLHVLSRDLRKAADFPPAVDLEFPKGPPRDAAEVLERLGKVVDRLEREVGVTPLLYTSARVWREDLGDVAPGPLDRCPLWLARYPFKAGPRKPPPSGAPPIPTGWPDSCWVWQYQGDATGVPGLSGTCDLDVFRPVLRGSAGARVEWVQRRLLALRANISPVSGIFDAATEAAVRRCQEDWYLTADGIVGPRTFARLCWPA